jgi:hypothetical protein
MNRDVMVQLDFAPKWWGYRCPGCIGASDEEEGSNGSMSSAERDPSSSSSSSRGQNERSQGGLSDAGEGTSMEHAGGSRKQGSEISRGWTDFREAEAAGDMPDFNGDAGMGGRKGTCKRVQWHMWVLLSRPTWISAELEDKDTDAMIEQLVEHLGKWAVDAPLFEL